MLIRYVSGIALILLSACSVSQWYPSSTTIPQTMTPTVTGSSQNSETIQTVAVGTGIERSVDLEMSGGVGYIEIDKSARAKIKAYFNSDGDKTLTAELETPNDAFANVRISQIILPDGKSDGPFGKNMQYILSQTGTYQLIISESLMEGTEWSGKVNLSVKIK